MLPLVFFRLMWAAKSGRVSQSCAESSERLVKASQNPVKVSQMLAHASKRLV